jgi:hypothetical protein
MHVHDVALHGRGLVVVLQDLVAFSAVGLLDVAPAYDRLYDRLQVQVVSVYLVGNEGLEHNHWRAH